MTALAIAIARRTICICPACGGDGKETCNNPDHGFISAIGGDTGRLGCPCCGHDPEHKIPGGGSCEICDGRGTVSLAVAKEFDPDDGVEIIKLRWFNNE